MIKKSQFKSKEFKTLLLGSLIILSIPNFFIFTSNTDKDLLETQSILSIYIEDDDDSIISKISDWNDLIIKADRNNNGLNDDFEIKLKSIDNLEFLGTINTKTHSLNQNDQELDSESPNKVSFIIQFPKGYDYSHALELFENIGGRIKYTYEYAINGFAGSLGYQSFELFYSLLKENDVSFYIEGDETGTTDLYFTSRNLNLRPYVWNTLDYEGDNQSSIAIIDTGIDEDHLFFDNDTTGKVLAWVDYTPGGNNDSAYDDNGHGSHCAGIAAGLGTIKDSEGRATATQSQNLDYYPFGIYEGSYDIAIAGSFNVPSLGEIEVECQFNDSTPLQDYVLADFLLVHDDIIVHQLSNFNPGDWQQNFTYDIISNDQLGEYLVAVQINFMSGDADDICWDANCTFRTEIHWPFSPSEYGSGNLWKGVAPDANLVSVKVFNEEGGGGISVLSDTLMGIDWCIANRDVYNISVISMSFGFFPGGVESLNDAVDNAVNHGIVAITSAGNGGPGDNNIVSPADSDKVITVAANNFRDEITYYSSQGGPSNSTLTKKPDITAPGGSYYNMLVFSADSNDNDAEGIYSTDYYANELWGAQGTSMSCPAVAGASNLLIQAMGGSEYWDWNSDSNSSLVKAILLMTATETYPLEREFYPEYSPNLNRGGKDVHEGYGRLNIDAAIEAWTINLTSPTGTLISISPPRLYSSYENSYAKHAYAGYVELKKDIDYTFNLAVPSNLDYDLYVYNESTDPYGEPDLIIAGVTPLAGADEVFNYTAEYTGKYFVVAKAIGIPIEDDDDDDDDDEAEPFDLIEFLTSPVGLLIIGLVAAAIIITLIGIRASRKSHKYDIERIRSYSDDYNY
ncbi:MAG: hypothetical protein EU539_00445 [Promethearchaeota archaeon]|nr:MAG: hypothetical protein EU539_00445 [Candidatus Lokiarchaeota archaeon]